MNARKTLLLDTNLLVLLIVGLTDKALVGRHKRTTEYVEEDFDLLRSIIRRFDELVTTPNIMTEASNLLAQIGDPHRQKLLAALGRLAQGTSEEYIPSKQACRRREFVRLGLTDSVSLEESRTASCLLTADLGLFLAVRRTGRFAVNFHDVRTTGWQWPS